MHKEELEGNWDILKGNIKEKWGKLTDNDLTEINGRFDQLVGRLEKTYGYSKDIAEKHANEFLSSMKVKK